MLKQAHIYIVGHVTGVGFRGWLRVYARKHNIKGWARNVFHNKEVFGNHGGVEAVLQGEETPLTDFIETIKEGAPLSHVDRVDIIPQDPTEVFEDFTILKSESFSHHS